MFQRMVAVPYEEYAQLSSNSKITEVKHPDDKRFYDLENEYASRGEIVTGQQAGARARGADEIDQ